MKTDALYQSLKNWELAVKLCEQLSVQLRREILVQEGDKRTREGRAEKEASQQHVDDKWEDETQHRNA